MNKNKLKGLIYGAFIGDAISLGPHWIYDIQDIQKKFYPINGFTSPDYTPYHKGKSAGDFTHYGDQALLLLQSLAKHQGFDLQAFKQEWLEMVNTKSMYLDHATKASIPLLANSDTGSDSDELGGFSRSAPMFLLPDYEEKVLIREIKLTHHNPSLHTIAAFLSRVIEDVLHDLPLSESLERHSNINGFIYDSYEQLSLDNRSIVESIKDIGQSCSSQYGLPSILSVLLKEDDFETALIQNAYAGGDSAARGMTIGMVLGAAMGYDKLPKELITQLHANNLIEEALSKLLD